MPTKRITTPPLSQATAKALASDRIDAWTFDDFVSFALETLIDEYLADPELFSQEWEERMLDPQSADKLLDSTKGRQAMKDFQITVQSFWRFSETIVIEAGSKDEAIQNALDQHQCDWSHADRLDVRAVITGEHEPDENHSPPPVLDPLLAPSCLESAPQCHPADFLRRLPRVFRRRFDS